MKRYTLIAVFAIIAVGLSFFLFSSYTAKIKGTGEALIGGHFTLTSQHGKQVSDQDFRGKYMLVYFGYTFCPDICPGDLLAITSVLNSLGDEATDVAPIFITIDPERDTVDQLASYISNFHPSFTALTGSQEAIDQATKAYRVYHAKVEDPSAAMYLMDHSAIIYLMDKEGKYLTHFPHGTKADAMLVGIKKYL